MTLHKKQLAAALLALLLILPILFTLDGGARIANAASSYSGVLEDLSKDETFNPGDYPDDKDNNGLQVIQIAESTDGELLVYVYQPAAMTLTLTATSIRISTNGDKDNPEPLDYKLTLLSRSGVFAKYVVDDFELKDDPIRYYDVVCIFRAWHPWLDDPATSESNKITEVACAVGKFFSATTLNDEVVYNWVKTNVVEITDAVIGRVRLGNGITWNGLEWCDAHYVAFDCNYDIDRLYEADVEFSTQTFETTAKGTKLGKVTPQEPVKLKYNEKTETVANDWFGYSFKWYEIETVEQFLTHGYSISDDDKADLKKQQYVLRFYESAYNSGADGEDVLIGMFVPFGGFWTLTQQFTKCSGTTVSDVSILRLNFEANGNVYNLGAVDNKRDGPKDVTPETSADNVPWWVWLLVAVGVVAVVLILICIFVPGAAPVIGRGLLKIGKAILWVILLPFRLLAALFRAIGNAIARRKATAAARSKKK